jgi:tRNA 5-methylaminomethyl-2-thiouridine biosynthesis bifunctional protein
VTYRRIDPAELAFAADGTPFSPHYGDIYHAASGGLEQARHVFLGGNGLLGEKAAWAGRERFVVLETGFGLGINFLATWLAWRDDPQRCRRLHFFSVEKHPFRRHDLARLHQRYPALAAVSAPLLDAWPLAVPGLHRLHFDAGAVTLTLAFGDADDLLPNLDLAADALYLDGFAPEKNPELWSRKIAHALARLAAPGATLATWSVAGAVKEALAAAGFELAKCPGFAAKRETLVGKMPGARTDIDPTGGDRRVIVVGAGAAGSSAANRLAARGCDVTVVERAAAPGCGASGNKAGVFRPLPSLDDAKLSRLLRACFLYGLRHLPTLAGVRYGLTGALQVARDARHEDIQRRVVEVHAAPPELVRFVDRDEAARLAGWPVALGGWWFERAGWINPPSLCAANLAGIDTRFGCTVERIERDDSGLWHLFDPAGEEIAQAPQLVLANGVDTPALAPGLPVRVGRGFVSHLPEDALPPFDIVATRNGYVTPAVDGIHCAGATLDADDRDPTVRSADHVENLQRLDAILPGYGKDLDPAGLAGRVGLRPMSPDRMPMVGALTLPGLWSTNGFGARGLVWAALCGELLASQIAGDPLPVERDIVQALEPQRFARPKNSQM